MRPTYGMTALWLLLSVVAAQAEDLPLTRNVPIPDFQNKPDDAKLYDFDAPPEGMFRSIVTAEGVEEEIGLQRTHELVPVTPTDRFADGSRPVFIVFALHQHYQSFQIFGRCYPEQVSGLTNETLVAEDAAVVALEDDTGYLKLLPDQGRWKPGRYRVEIHVGEQISEMSLIGTMRFTITSTDGR